MRQDWNDARIDVMILALRAKFSQDQKLKALLKSTGKALLVEDSPKDAFWGIGLQKDGLNHLGKCLMIVRNEL